MGPPKKGLRSKRRISPGIFQVVVSLPTKACSFDWHYLHWRSSRLIHKHSRFRWVFESLPVVTLDQQEKATCGTAEGALWDLQRRAFARNVEFLLVFFR